MKTHLLHRSFAGGEVSPEMLSRIDDVRFATGARRAENMITLPHGPARRRPGFRFVRKSGNQALKQNLLPFRFSATEAYALEIGARSGGSPDPVGYIRLHTNGSTVLVPTGGGAPRAYVTAQNATVVTIATEQITFGSAHGLLTGDEIEFTTSGTIWPGLVVGVRYFALVIDTTNITDIKKNTFTLLTVVLQIMRSKQSHTSRISQAYITNMSDFMHISNIIGFTNISNNANHTPRA